MCYVRQLNFLGPVSRGYEKVLLANRRRSPAKMKEIDKDVQAIVQDHNYLYLWSKRLRHERTRRISAARAWRAAQPQPKSTEFSVWVFRA
eukprot:scaffold21812_cov110-Isochrysis_galbana.AAC.24